MMKRMNQFVAISLMISLTISFGCEKEEKDKAPQLPPASSFVTDFSEFDQGAAKKSTEVIENNFVTAAVAVVYMNSVLTVGLAIPVAAYAEAFNHDAMRVDNDTWEWTYDVIVEDITYTAVLTADVVGEMVNWEMRISQEEGFQDFLWYSGSCDILRTSGTWTLYNNPEDNQEVLTIDWNHDWELGTFDVTYTYVTESNYYGSYIEYGLTEDTDYDAYYIIDDTAQVMTYVIHYNTETHAGKIEEFVNEDPVFEGCWDSNLQNADCTPVE